MSRNFIQVIDLTITLTNEQLTSMMMNMLESRQLIPQGRIVCTVNGFKDDPRELWQIPEVKNFFKRLIELGFISFLDISSGVVELGGDASLRGTLGAAEIVQMSKGEVNVAFSPRDLADVIMESNRRAEEVLGIRVQ